MTPEIQNDDDSFADIEAMLAKMKPIPLSDNLLSQLAAAMNEATVSPPENVISMDELRLGTQKLQPAEKSHSRFSMKWGWAAAVAVLGACSALLYPSAPDSKEFYMADAQSNVYVEQDSSRTDSAVPNPANSSVAVAYDGLQPVEESPLNEKTLWLNSDSPHKQIKTNYTRVYRGTDADGRVIEFSVPATRVFVIPDEAY